MLTIIRSAYSAVQPGNRTPQLSRPRPEESGAANAASPMTRTTARLDAVRPGDCIVGDQDGVVVVPAAKAEMVYSIAHGREVIEEIVKEELTKNPGPPGRFYPFMSGKIKVDSPLGKLLATKGITPENSNQFEGTANW